MRSAPHTCPLCQSGKSTCIGDELFRCGSCGAAFNDGHHSLQYDTDYFIKEYRDQYGRTYEEDFPHIYSLAMERLDTVFSLLDKQASLPSLSLIDIGSALGFFLKAARDRGVGRVMGIEISDYAGSYCREHFGIDVINDSFDNIKELPVVDMITAWFFIEHCADPARVMRLIYDSLNPGGVFAFSAPSVSGPLYHFHRSEWIETHPADHRVDFTPGAARRALKQAGFRRVEVRPCGFHPERILSPSSRFYAPFSGLYRLFSGLTAYSDTIEIYAIK